MSEDSWKLKNVGEFEVHAKPCRICGEVLVLAYGESLISDSKGFAHSRCVIADEKGHQRGLMDASDWLIQTAKEATAAGYSKTADFLRP